MAVPSVVRELVDRFPEPGSPSFRALKETAVRREFIDPFFEALGWDVANKTGESFLYKEVIHEDQIRTRSGTVRAPDYAFRIQGQRKFFVEAKKPSTPLKENPRPARQLRDYAWSANLPLSILSDFQEFGVYDCRVEPAANDGPDTACEFFIAYEDYEQEWDRIYEIFSKEAVLAGSLEHYAKQAPRRKGIKSVDAAFLKDMEMFRLSLAQNIAARNKGLSDEQLNFAVQMTLNRILFLRISEDRGIEPFEQLKLQVYQDSAYGRLCRLFQTADERYNSGLFHFRNERGRTTPSDDLSMRLQVDDDVVRSVVDRLYYPHPYKFEMIPIEIMGKVYEQFLGQVIERDKEGRVQIVPKPEVLKAGGIYYTPVYIVEYVVRTILDDVLAGKNPKQAEGIHIIDPACGSGTFLVGAYRYLLKWHREQYLEDHKKYKKLLYMDIYGEWQLTPSERKRILLNNIYGVDIDAQAVENTKLALLMMVLEGATTESLGFQLSFARERALPDLDTNIKCGNSLIDFSHQEIKEVTEEDRRKINPFDWGAAFPSIMQSGGFDIALGNPPYTRIQIMKEWAPLEVSLYQKIYTAASLGNYDKYAVFVEKGLQLLNQQGRLGYILPNKFFNADYGEPLRKLLAVGQHLSRIVHFGDQQVFDNASTYTALLFLNKHAQRDIYISRVDDLEKWARTGEAQHGQLSAASIGADKWNLMLGPGSDLLERLQSMPVKLADVTTRIFQGIKTSADKIYIVEEQRRDGGRVEVYSPQRDTKYWLEEGLLHPLIKGGDSKPYQLSRTNRQILFPYVPTEAGPAKLISGQVLGDQYPLTWQYLQDNEAYLREREHGKMDHAGWYGYVYPKALDVMPLPKIFTPDIAPRASFSFDPTGDVFFTGGVSGGYGILVSASTSYLYLLGLLNSKVLEWVVRQTATQMRGGYYSFESRYIRHLPIRGIDFSNRHDAQRHDKLIQLVETRLLFHSRRRNAPTPAEKVRLDASLHAVEVEIDNLVYDLYSLSKEDMALIEAVGKNVIEPAPVRG